MSYDSSICERVCGCKSPGSESGLIKTHLSDIAHLGGFQLESNERREFFSSADRSRQFLTKISSAQTASKAKAAADADLDPNHFIADALGFSGVLNAAVSLKFDFDWAKKEVTVTLKVEKPISFEHTWVFGIGDVIRPLSQKEMDKEKLKEAVAAGLDKWCVIKCGGLAILGILISCLPALGGGPAAYVACVVARAGEGAAGIALCIVEKCV